MNFTTFNMRGGTISDNTSSNHGGGVSSSGTFNMSGNATISGNTAEHGGGVTNSGTFSISETAVISGNTADFGGGGVFNDGSGSITMTGGTIGNGNAAQNGNGGGILNAGTLDMQNGAISGNTAIGGEGGGGVYNLMSFTMSGGTITGNTAVNGGGVLNDSGFLVVFTRTGGIITGNTIGDLGDMIAPAFPPAALIQNMTVTYGEGGTHNIPQATGTQPIWYLLIPIPWDTGTIPPGVTINEDTAQITVAPTVAAGTYSFHINARNVVAQTYAYPILFNLMVNAPLERTMTVGTQVGRLTAGTAGTVTFPIVTANIADGTYNVTAGSLPSGVSIQGQVTITDNTGTLTLTGDATIVAGSHTLSLELDNVPSPTFTLFVEEPVASVIVTGANAATTITTNGGVLQMSADIHPNTATNQTVTWSVIPGTGSATIDAAGFLTATANGTVTVRATAADGTGIFGELIITISGQITTFTVTFDLDGGIYAGNQALLSQTIANGQNATALTQNPTRASHTFVNWFTAQTGGTVFDFATPITADTTIHARWTAITTPGPWTVTFDLNGGNFSGNTANVVMENVVDGTNVTPPANPTRAGYTFNGWTPAGAYNNVTSSRTITAQWTADIPGNGGNVGTDSHQDSQDTRTHAQSPWILQHPQDVTVYVGEYATLSVTVGNITDSGALTFQWYRATGASGGSFVRIPGATGSTFSPNTEATGVNRYRVVVTNTNNNPRISGDRVVRTFSQTATVTVTEPSAAPLPLLRLDVGSYTFTHNGATRQSDAAPFIDPAYDRLMIPLRLIAEAMGANVAWHDETRSVTISAGTAQISLTIGEALPNGMGVPVIVNNRTFVPLRYVTEILGGDVTWDEENRAVYVFGQVNLPSTSPSDRAVAYIDRRAIEEIELALMANNEDGEPKPDYEARRAARLAWLLSREAPNRFEPEEI